MMKRCFKCLCEKPISDFYKHSKMADGHLNKCKVCTRADVASHRSANLEMVRAYDVARSALPHRVALRKAVVSQWMKDFPERRRAQGQVALAVKTGKLIRWPCCAVPSCDKKSEAHHPNYQTPLEVVWLCRAHHKQAHAITRSDST